MPLLDDGKEWDLFHGDCIPHLLRDMPEECVDFSIYSPPFPSVFSYTDSNADVGNVDAMDGEASVHLSFMFNGLYRVLKPGRVAIVHVAQIPRMKRSGGVGLCDFRGITLRLAERAGFIYEYDWSVRKNPQALRNGTGVLTPTGFVPIETLSVGDRVIGSNGMATQVRGVWPHKQKRMYRVTFSDGAEIDCDANHIWTVNKNYCRYDSGWVNRTAAELFDIGAKFPSGESRWCVPTVPHVEFAKNELPLDPYIVGVLLGDGMLSGRGVVGICSESEIVESLTLPETHYYEKLKNSDKGGGVASFHIRSTEWQRNDVLNACREIGIAGKRSWEKTIPDAYKIASRDDRIALLQGMMDTDGTIKKNGSCYYATTSYPMAESFQFVVESLGGMCRISCEEFPQYQYKGENRTGRPRYVCCVRLTASSGICPFRMKRKADKWKPLTRETHRRIVSIERMDIDDCTCITVEADDGLFVTERCIVTHNSQAIRTRSRELQFAGLESDRAAQRGTLQDYLIKIRKPGNNAVPIRDWDTVTNEYGDDVDVDKYSTQVSRNDWIKWAEGCWDDIQETDTLNTAAAKSDDDTRHICPLQIEVIRRCILLFSNPGEIVFSPFAGIGSEGYVALGGKSPKTGKYLHDPRRFYGCELKDEYYEQAKKNLAAACANRASAKARSLFDDDEGE